MTTNPIARLHKRVWQVRAEISHTWLTPSPIDCLRYAVTEVGEAMDAWLRAQRPDDSRNNSRELDVLDELGDCAIMLASALPADSRPPEYDPPCRRKVTLDKLAHGCAHTLAVVTKLNRARMIEWTLTDIYHYSGFTPTVALLRLERIRAKHTTETEFVTNQEFRDARGEYPLACHDDLIEFHRDCYVVEWYPGMPVATTISGWRDGMRLIAQRYTEISQEETPC